MFNGPGGWAKGRKNNGPKQVFRREVGRTEIPAVQIPAEMWSQIEESYKSPTKSFSKKFYFVPGSMQVNANKDDRNVEMINQKSSTPFNFEAVFAPPQASEIPPMPRNLVDEAVHPVEARRPPRYYREYTNGWLGRTPSKQQHRTKAIEALAEIRREDAQQKLFEESKMENGRKKTSAGTEDSIKPLMEKDLALIDTHYEGASHMETKPTSTTGRRVPLYCTICHRGGHSTQICYHNTDNPKDVLRCYNCGKTGHLAVRCPLLHSCGEDGSSASSQQQKDDAKSKAAKKRRNTAKISQKKKAAAEAEALKKNSVGLELICKVMADRPLREETEKHNPDLYEEMLTLMLDAITVAHS